MEIASSGRIVCGLCQKSFDSYEVKDGWVTPKKHFDDSGFYCNSKHLLIICGSCGKRYILENEKEAEKCFFCGENF